jgi:putative transposase
MADARLDRHSRHESLESRVRGKLAGAVRRGADRKGLLTWYLAGGLPDSTGRRWKRANSTAALIYAPVGNGWDKLPRLRSSNHAPRQSFTLLMSDALGLVPKSAQQMVAATIRTVFAQPDSAAAREQWRRVADMFRPRFARLADLLDAAEADVLAYLAFPAGHWRQVWSNNPLERLNKEVKRRTDVVGIFPNTAAVTRLVGCILAEQHDEWQAARRYFSVGSIAKLNPDEEVGPLPLLAAN